MPNVNCNNCAKTFTRSYDMKRQTRKFHSHSESTDGLSSHTDSPSLQEDSKRSEFQQPVELQHPFTMCISGPSPCGKTQLVKRILRNISMTPEPDRIIWMYKRWQPLYTEMKSTILPPIEFVQGIPIDLEKDSFPNPKVHNLIVLDDLSPEKIQELPIFLRKAVTTETCQLSPSIKTYITQRTQPKEETAIISLCSTTP